MTRSVTRSAGRPTAAFETLRAPLDDICRDPDFCLRFQMRPGDIQIANNYATFQGRTKYQDFAEPEKRRHLLRMWLSLPNGRKLPPNCEGTREFGVTFARRMRPDSTTV